MSLDQENLEVARRAMELWNQGDLEGVLDLYSDDAVMHPAAEWPEQASWHGREGVRENMEQWRSVWDSSEMVVDSLESYGDRVVASGAWLTRGRVSGLDGRWAFNIVLTIRDGMIATHEWFTEREPALAAARDS
jgi:ketosteroid isomerase-like protein